MNTKQIAVDETFVKWLNSSSVKKPAYFDCWHAAWAARGVADIAAVKSNKPCEQDASYDSSYFRSDGARTVCDEIEVDIRALDEDVK
jgi:hypothetical protein